jgi:hypothetical protein
MPCSSPRLRSFRTISLIGALSRNGVRWRLWLKFSSFRTLIISPLGRKDLKLAPGAINKFNGNYLDTFTFTREAYYSLKPEDFLRIAQKYKVRYLVIEKPHLQPFPVVYENEGFAVYDLQSVASLKY